MRYYSFSQTSEEVSPCIRAVPPHTHSAKLATHSKREHSRSKAAQVPGAITRTRPRTLTILPGEDGAGTSIGCHCRQIKDTQPKEAPSWARVQLHHQPTGAGVGG